MTPEQKARELIDDQRHQSGWEVQSSNAKDILVASGAAAGKLPLESAGCTGDTGGRCPPEVPADYAVDFPHRYLTIPAEQRAARCHLTTDACVIDAKEFFIRGRLEIPVLNGPRPFVWGVWASLDEKTFKQVIELRDDGREQEPPYSGWLCTTIPNYPETLSLKVDVYIQPLKQRPLIELEPTNHPLAVEQRNGITMARVGEIVAALLQHRGKEFPMILA